MRQLMLKFERSGKLLEVAEHRRDGWPICPSCNDDELAATKALSGTPPDRTATAADIDFCHSCGPVRVVVSLSGDGDPGEALPGVG